MKVVTVETLAKAITMAVEGGRTDAEVFAALPATPLAEEVEAAVVVADDAARGLVKMATSAGTPELVRYSEAIDTIIAALHAATAEVERLRAIEARGAEVAGGHWVPWYASVSPLADTADYILHGDEEASDV